MKKTLIIVLIIMAVGCSKKYTRAPEDTSKPAELVIEETTPVETEVVEEIAVAKEEEVTEIMLSPEEEAKSVFQDVLFDYDKYAIRAEARPTLDSAADFLNRNPELNIAIEGHCDERGTNEYNLALGEKRGNAAKNYLASLGVSSSRMMVITYGEEKPLCSGHDEDCWQQNRRAHFIIVKRHN